MEHTQPWHAMPADAVLDQLRASPGGLTSDDAARRLASAGPNEIPRIPARSPWRILADQLRTVVVLLLVAAAVVALVAGETAESLAIGAVLLLNTVLGFSTEWRARRAMDALLALETPGATVLRDGQRRDVAARELVAGDLLELEAGQAVPADARIVAAAEVRIDEAALTGESMPVHKDAGAVIAAATPLAERRNMLYQAGVVLTGRARAVVVATGVNTELGRIGTLVGSVDDVRTPLECRLDQLGRRLIAVALAAGALVAILGALRGANLMHMVETGIALAIAAVPEGLPAVATVAMAIGVHRMARRHALVRRLPVVETLGSTTVVCTDKTGTLTSGEMAVTVVWDGAGERAAAELRAGARDLRTAAIVAALCNRADIGAQSEGARGDPTEIALLRFAAAVGVDRKAELAAQREVAEIPFSSERRYMATFHAASGSALPDELRAMVKGAPARVLERCVFIQRAGGIVTMNAAERAAVQAQNEAMAERGLRVLALATGVVASPTEDALRGLVLVGLAGLSDPIAPGVRETIALLRDAGVQTVMITGDQRRTAVAIARDLGMMQAGDEIVDGAALAALDDAALEQRAGAIRVVSRVSPEDKLRLVAAHQRRGAIVAMLGDGVNDAPALKAADVGVAMGRRGSDVARQAASVVLQDDRFETIGAAVEEGRIVFDNIRKFVFYLFSCNLAEVLVLVVASLAGLPLPLLPLQILWLNLVTDTAPALALAFEPAEQGLMRQRPRDPRDAILSSRLMASIALYAAAITVVTLAAFAVALATTDDVARAVTWSFATLALAQAFHLGNARSGRRVTSRRAALANPYAAGALLLTVAFTILAVQFPPLARVLDTQPLALGEWAIVAALGALPAVIGQALKAPRRMA